jgi:hypothetical protein
MMKKQLKNGDSIRITWSDGRTGVITAKSRSVLVLDFPKNVRFTNLSQDQNKKLIIENQHQGGKHATN